VRDNRKGAFTSVSFGRKVGIDFRQIDPSLSLIFGALW
jgi:hypothetical protein